MLVSIFVNVPVNNFSVISGQSHHFLGIISTCWEVNVSCSRTQHINLSEVRTPNRQRKCVQSKLVIFCRMVHNLVIIYPVVQ